MDLRAYARRSTRRRSAARVAHVHVRNSSVRVLLEQLVPAEAGTSRTRAEALLRTQRPSALPARTDAYSFATLRGMRVLKHAHDR